MWTRRHGSASLSLFACNCSATCARDPTADCDASVHGSTHDAWERLPTCPRMVGVLASYNWKQCCQQFLHSWHHSVRCNQSTIFFSYTKLAPASIQPSVLFSHNKSAPATSHSQPHIYTVGCELIKYEKGSSCMVAEALILICC